jgi:hypothetical protein
MKFEIILDNILFRMINSYLYDLLYEHYERKSYLNIINGLYHIIFLHAIKSICYQDQATKIKYLFGNK